jgi:hypothetical protein
MVMIDQVCWNEMNVNDELTLKCEGQTCQWYEKWLRRTLFQWKYFPVDMVVDPFMRVDKAICNTGFDVGVKEQVAISDPANLVKGHKYENQFENDGDLEKIHVPRVRHDPAETEKRLAMAHELFDGIMDVRLWGHDPYLSLWDPLATWMGVENALYTMVDRPEFMHRILARMTDGYLSML